MLHTRLTADWRLSIPILSAPMSGGAGGRLARAVTRSGGLGLIGIGSVAPVSMIEAEAAAARGDDAGRFGIGLMAWAIDRRPELLDATIAQQPELVSISFGDPTPYVSRLHTTGIKVATQVHSRDETRQALDAGVDLLVAQGTEAGGHTAQVATLPLLQIVLDEVAGKVPVLAAGGIASPRGLAAVLAAGADGGWIGTALLASPEATFPDAAKRRVLNGTETDTILTRAFDVAQSFPWPRQFPGRALRNDFNQRWTGREDELPAHPNAVAEFAQAVKAGDYSRAHIYAGQAIGMIRDVRPAGDIVRDIADGAEALLRQRLREMLPS